MVEMLYLTSEIGEAINKESTIETQIQVVSEHSESMNATSLVNRQMAITSIIELVED